MSGDVTHTPAAQRLYVLYGSETGNAESIARRLHHDAVTSHSFADAECMTLNHAVAKKLFDAQLADDATTSLSVVIVCSTTGDGEPPQNAARFRRWLRSTAGTLHNTRYCLLALGDTNYNNFCAPGIFIDKRLCEMGAVRCYPRGEADDGVGLHLVVNPWTEGLWAALKKSDMEGSAPIGLAKSAPGQLCTGTSVSREAAILYSSASQLCASTALFLHERIAELGGEADLYPIPHFHPSTSLRRPPTVILFILGAECDAGTCRQESCCTGQELPPLGTLRAWIGSGDSRASPPAETAEQQSCMAVPPRRFFGSLFIAQQPDDASRATVLDANLKAIAASCQLELLYNRQPPGEVLSVAVSDQDAFLWLEKVLGSLPGVTADAEHIHRSLELFFNSRVGTAFRSALAPALLEGRDAESDKEATSGGAPPSSGERYELRDLEPDGGSGDTECTSAGGDAIHGGGASKETHQVLGKLLTPMVYVYSEESAFVKQCATDIFCRASQHHLRCSIEELSNFGQRGFPRGSTFAFVVSGAQTKSTVHVLNVLRTLKDQRKHLEDIKFAILGIGTTSQCDGLNACAVELETHLLELKANRVFCTGLADTDSSSFWSSIQSFKLNLWNAVASAEKNAAYLEVELLTEGGSAPEVTLSLGGASVNESAGRGADSGGGSGGNGVVASDVFGHRAGVSTISSAPSLPGGGVPSRASDTSASLLAAESVIGKPKGDLMECKKTRSSGTLDTAAALEIVTRLDDTCGGGGHGAGDGLGEAEEHFEETQSLLSTEVGSHSADASTAQDWRTESSVVNWSAYRSDDADGRVYGVVQSWKLLTHPRARHPVAQLDLSVDVETQWVPGQTIAVFPSNSAAEVEALLHLFRLKPDDPFVPLTLAHPDASVFPAAPLYQAVKFPLSCGVLLLRYVELRVTGCQKVLFELLERHCVSNDAKATVRDMYATLCTDRTPRKLREVLETVVAVADSLPPFRHVVENLSLMQPRQYSICSSHRANPATLSICFKVVEDGLCTGWMYEQCLSAAGLPLMPSASADFSPAESKVASCAVRHPVRSNTVTVARQRAVIPFVFREASAFRMPRNPLLPMILIGSGTGIAPFRAFLQEREAWLAEHRLLPDSTSPEGKPSAYSGEEATHHRHAVCGSIHVFFGCRHPDEDYLFGDELAQWKESGVARSLVVAFSRDTNDRGGLRGGGCYVQDEIQERGAVLMELILQRSAHVFVCGDADGMAKGVHDTLRKLIQQHLSLNDGAAAKHLEKMRMDGRYVRDVWSTRMRK
ncbi:hypothetical protein CUR178_00510 [Leishmania enriettii]|uniref:NADPH--hemoprotein reductase n=1 Tax=Leishmania enriettii TaxID=5663 RepID=A0A836GEC3_LEIEN|nr:hypothetical protein CUR178_00510 [Leishmania enriettii]